MPADQQEHRDPGSSTVDAPAVAGRPGQGPVQGFGEWLDAMPAGVGLLSALQDADLDGLPAFELVEVVAQARRLSGLAHALQARAAAALAVHPDMHHPDLGAGCRLPAGVAFVHADVAAAELSLRLLVPEHEARLLIREGKAYAGPLAATGAALAEGRIDVPRARAIVRRVGDEPAEIAAAVEARVLPQAAARSVAQVRGDVERALTRVDPEHAADRHRTARAGRCVSRPKVLADGMAGLWAVLPAEHAVRVDAVLDAAARCARDTGDPRTLDQLRADAFVDHVLGPDPLAAGGTGGSTTTDGALVAPTWRDTAHAPPTDTGARAVPTAADAAPTPCEAIDAGADATVDADPACDDRRAGHVRPARARTVVHVTVPLTTLMGADDQPAELAGYGPIDADQARALALDLGSTWRRLVTDPLSGTVLDVGRTTYRPPAALAEHVRHRDKYCAAPGCTVPAHRCDLDHTLEYDPPPDGAPARPLGTTSADNLGTLCRRHHRLKTAGILQLGQPHPGQYHWQTLTGHQFRVHPGTEAPTIHLTAPQPPAPHAPEPTPPF